ncbi:MAG: mechanosensitive ion channel [Deltaproteobacteria bacterium]|nr:mechanosensitive ion channel [Deltaproteobacteria bacterium]
MNIDNIIQKVWELVTFYGIKVIAAIVILIVGRWIAMGFRKLLERMMKSSKLEPTIISFIGNLSYIALLIFFIIAALNQLGIQTASFIAVIGAAGLAIGLALQGSLANFASGFLMIIFRPFKVGDYIEGAGVAGVVEEIQIFTTTMTTPDNKTVIIPNAKLTEGNLINWSTKGTRRVDLVFGIGYGDDIDKAKKIMSEILSADERILKSPAPQIAVSELADSSVNFVVRPWVKSGDYWNVYFDLVEKVKKTFDKEGVSIPFPQRDIHIYEHDGKGGEVEE